MFVYAPIRIRTEYPSTWEVMNNLLLLVNGIPEVFGWTLKSGENRMKKSFLSFHLLAKIIGWNIIFGTSWQTLFLWFDGTRSP